MIGKIIFSQGQALEQSPKTQQVQPGVTPPQTFPATLLPSAGACPRRPPVYGISILFALFDEAGKFLTGRVMSEAETSFQIELDSGKRVKVKSANVLLKFDKPAPDALMSAAQTLSEQIELDLAWEFAPEHEFGFADLALSLIHI